MFEEDYLEEQFFAAVRKATGRGGGIRDAGDAQEIIGTLDF